MRIEFDPEKSRRNEHERGLPFTRVAEFEFRTAVTVRDGRRDYPEPRFVAKGFIGTRLFVLCYTPVPGGIRVISFRKANAREVKRHENKTAD